MRKIDNPIINGFFGLRNGVIHAPAIVPLDAKFTKAWLRLGKSIARRKPAIDEHR